MGLFILNCPKLEIFGLGDSAATIDLGGKMDESLNEKVLAIRKWLIEHPFPGMGDLIAAYNSLTVHYDAVAIRCIPGQLSSAAAFVKYHLQEAFQEAAIFIRESTKTIHIPVCYLDDYGSDMQFICNNLGASADQIIALHSEPVYRVYMIGFLPGFPYLGELNAKLVHQRKERPVAVKGGSIGIAGGQTGIYPFDSPGGWQIIGRTPLRIFDAEAAQPCTFRPGDMVKFYPIGAEEFEALSRIENKG